MQPMFDVFISRKSADSAVADELYHYLKNKGLSVFVANETLRLLRDSDYRKTIDQALDACTHMIVVGTRREHIIAPWVEAEWGYYINCKRSGEKKGNILTVIAGDLTIRELPGSLSYYEVIEFHKKNFDTIYGYVSDGRTTRAIAPPMPYWLKNLDDQIMVSFPTAKFCCLVCKEMIFANARKCPLCHSDFRIPPYSRLFLWQLKIRKLLIVVCATLVVMFAIDGKLFNGVLYSALLFAGVIYVLTKMQHFKNLAYF